MRIILEWQLSKKKRKKYVNQRKINSYKLKLMLRLLMAVRFYYQADVKFAGFQTQLKASRVSSHTDELWYNDVVYLWITIYITLDLK